MSSKTVNYFLPYGDRVYAIGDIHGCYSNLMDLMTKIYIDLLKNKGSYKRSILVYLGDYIDRGPRSREVLDYILKDCHWTDQTVRLYGNHEQLFNDYLHDRQPGTNLFLKHGGKKTLESYGNDIKRIPTAHREFLANPLFSFRLGEFLFSHAGMNPLRSAETQDFEKNLWNFKRCDKDMGVYSVHGHMSSDEVELTPYRLNLDTGAWRKGKLSCGVIQANEIRILQTAL